MAARGNRIDRLFTREQFKAAPSKEIENLCRRNREGWTTLPSIQRESQVNVHAARLEQAGHEVGILGSAAWVNGAEACVFQKVIKGII